MRFPASSGRGRRRALTAIAAAALLALAAACATTVGPFNSNVQVSFATRGATAAPAPVPGAAPQGQAALSDTITDGTHTLIITKAQVALADVRLERQDTTCASESSGCEEISLAPVLVDLPLVPGALPQFSVQLPVGAYEQISFQLHKVTSQDPADLQPLLGRSIHVEGTYDGEAVTFDADLDVGEELGLNPALVVTDTTTLANVTVKILVGSWFLAPDSTVLNPQTGNHGGPNESVILNNIQQSMQAFEDDNHTGEPDR